MMLFLSYASSNIAWVSNHLQYISLFAIMVVLSAHNLRIILVPSPQEFYIFFNGMHSRHVAYQVVHIIMNILILLSL